MVKVVQQKYEYQYVIKVYSARNILDKGVYAVKAIEKSFLKLSENGNGMVIKKYTLVSILIWNTNPKNFIIIFT